MGVAAVSRCCVSHRAKLSGGSATTRNPILACWCPQNSAHWPRYSPAESACSQRLFSRPGIRSRLPLRLGGQKLWMTSVETSSTTTGRPTGMWISLAVVTQCCGSESRYWTSHHH